MGHIRSHLRKLTRNSDVSRADVEEFLTQGSYMNMQVLSKGGQGSSMRRETINKANLEAETTQENDVMT